MKRLSRILRRSVNWIVLSLIEILPYGPVANRIKRWLLVRYGAKVGENPNVYSGVWIRPIRGLTLGDNVSIGKNVLITTAGGVTVGSNVLVGHGSKIISANHIIPEGTASIRFSGHHCQPVVIEDDVWIAAQVVILPGVRIGRGAVVAAGAVVNEDIQPFTVVGGVPARLIRNRVEPDTNIDVQGELE